MESFLKSFLEPTAEAFLQLITLLLMGSISAQHIPEKVAEASLVIPEYEEIQIVDRAKFLNDLMLSPHWGVTKDRDGNYVANLRKL